MNPDISIIVPCYNLQAYLDECLLSVLDQSYKNWECIIVNDGSTDNSELLAMEWVKKDDRFKYTGLKNSGVSCARNMGIAIAKGTYILPLDGDDKISADYVSAALAAFENNPGISLVYCEAEFFGQKTGKWDLPDYTYRELFCDNMIFCSAVFRRADWERINGYDESIPGWYEDWDFWLRLLSRDSKVLKLPFVGFFYRKKEQNSMLKDFESHQDFSKTINYILAKQVSNMADAFGNPGSSFNDILKKYSHLLKDHSRRIESEAKIMNNFLAKSLYIIARKISSF